MPERDCSESVMEFTPVLKGSDAVEKRFRGSRFSPYKVALALYDFVLSILSFLGALWFAGVGPLIVSQPTQYAFILILSLMVLAFFPTFHLYHYRYIFMKKTHLTSLIKAFFWGFLSVGVVVALYEYPRLLDEREALVVVAVVAIGLLLLSRFFWAEILHIVKALGLSFVAVGIFGLLLPDEIPIIAEEGRAFLYAVFLSVAAILLSRLFLVHLVFGNWLRRRFRRQVAILGSGDVAKRITEHIVEHNAPFWVAGFLGPQDGKNPELPMSKVLLGELKSLPSIVQKEKLDDIIITDEGIDKKVLISLMDYCTSEGLSVWFPPKLMPIIDMKLYIDNFCGLPMIRLCSQKHDWVFSRIKHAADALMTLPVFVLLLPLFMIIALAIKLNSPGPVFYKAMAIGKNGARFVMYKFRSMRADTSSGIHKDYVTRLIKGEISPDTEGAQPLKVADDPRITKVGKLLRKTSMDELPQLINVIKGDMSLVGPRPCLPYEFEIYKDWHKKRLSVRPGISGLWQVAGRSAVAFEDMVLLDLYYVYNRNLSMDMNILYETIFAVLAKKGAY